MHIHILGICGTFMGGLAVLAKSLGHHVSGSDAHVYPPMSVQLADQGIELMEGYHPDNLQPEPDLVVVGNAMSRGNPELEAVLERNLRYTSGPQWLSDYVLQERWVLAVAGTHGKTTTSSMLAAILDYAHMAPGFLIGGIPEDFGVSARLGDTPFFVVEADEYDSAFFDKRSKFVHYRPRTLILNNLEFDHADIFPDLAAIQRQFHHLVRTVPASGLIVRPTPDTVLDEVLEQGCWSQVSAFGQQDAEWQLVDHSEQGGHFSIVHQGSKVAEINWHLSGRHNQQNAIAAIIAARHVGVPVDVAAEALQQFQGVKRRQEKLGCFAGVTLYDDFAHHPTAIATTLAGMRSQIGAERRLLAVIEPRSNTMRMGHHRELLASACQDADIAFWLEPDDLSWSLADALNAANGDKQQVHQQLLALRQSVLAEVRDGDHVVIMSNGGFGGLHQQLREALETGETP